MKDKKNNTWLFLGPEIGEKEAAVNELRKTLSPDGQMEETVYYAGETPVSVMVTAMLNGSLFADKRLFFIKCAEGLKKEEAALLSSYIASPADDTFLVLISEETSIARELENHIPQSNRRVFWELSDSRKSAWVQTFFRQEGFKISPEGVETILELVENNTAALKQECSRLILFLARSQDRGSSEITGEEAERWLSHTREESAFTLFSRIAAGDFSRCLESARVLIAAKVSPVVIFAGLASCFKKLISYLALTGAGVTDEQEFRKIGVYAAGAKRDYGAAGRRYDSAAAETCLALTVEYDLLLRSSGSFPEQILLDQYLYKIYSLSKADSKADSKTDGKGGGGAYQPETWSQGARKFY